MHVIIWLIIGGIIGWLASIVMKTNAQQGIVLNVVVGIVGSWIGGWLIAPVIGGSGMMAYVSAFIGAVVLLGIANLFRRGRVR
ncbi:GlsB/YeaQ/YmgE family stress response membrane protein [Thermomonas sp.]|uniref:GlsB/YeaQ/YmgE family stress response membrane protein n=1 Tax=Thermomonas sp. TaxID=1971895 RepID=UPI0026349213|nr:GlsB/YeaQ/YmgE family stress response membrane protein [Thermomonas sp.]